MSLSRHVLTSPDRLMNVMACIERRLDVFIGAIFGNVVMMMVAGRGPTLDLREGGKDGFAR